MSTNQENPPYITAVKVYGVWHVNYMEWSIRADSYQVTVSKNYGNHEGSAKAGAIEWARKEGVEYR